MFCELCHDPTCLKCRMSEYRREGWQGIEDCCLNVIGPELAKENNELTQKLEASNSEKERLYCQIEELQKKCSDLMKNTSD